MRSVIDSIQRNESLISLNISNCDLNQKGIDQIIIALRLNPKIRKLAINGNFLESNIFDLITAEADANALLMSLKTNAQSIDASTLHPNVSMTRYYRYCYLLLFYRYTLLWPGNCVFCQKELCRYCMRMILLTL